jgi:hypothetical protein
MKNVFENSFRLKGTVTKVDRHESDEATIFHVTVQPPRSTDPIVVAVAHPDLVEWLGLDSSARIPLNGGTIDLDVVHHPSSGRAIAHRAFAPGSRTGVSNELTAEIRSVLEKMPLSLPETSKDPLEMILIRRVSEDIQRWNEARAKSIKDVMDFDRTEERPMSMTERTAAVAALRSIADFADRRSALIKDPASGLRTENTRNRIYGLLERIEAPTTAILSEKWMGRGPARGHVCSAVVRADTKLQIKSFVEYLKAMPPISDQPFIRAVARALDSERAWRTTMAAGSGSDADRNGMREVLSELAKAFDRAAEHIVPVRERERCHHLAKHARANIERLDRSAQLATDGRDSQQDLKSLFGDRQPRISALSTVVTLNAFDVIKQANRNGRFDPALGAIAGALAEGNLNQRKNPEAITRGLAASWRGLSAVERKVRDPILNDQIKVARSHVETALSMLDIKAPELNDVGMVDITNAAHKRAYECIEILAFADKTPRAVQKSDDGGIEALFNDGSTMRVTTQGDAVLTGKDGRVAMTWAKGKDIQIHTDDGAIFRNTDEAVALVRALH